MITDNTRRGFLLVVAAGIAMLLAGLTLALIIRLRSGASDAEQVTSRAQAHAMLAAACQYILEAGRVGWDDPATPEHEEGYGWIDVRDGFMGPKSMAIPRNEWPLFDPLVKPSPNFPVGTVARCPMYRWSIPPYAIAPVYAPNPIATPANGLVADTSDPAFGLPLLRNPDDTPVAGITDFASFRSGNALPVPASLGRAWFRVCRDGPATFTLTIGVGATGGWKDWAEVVASGATEVFSSQDNFEFLFSNERRWWYRCEWSPAIGQVASSMGGINRAIDNFSRGTFEGDNWGGGRRSALLPARNNAVGTLRWLQRLRQPPDRW